VAGGVDLEEFGARRAQCDAFNVGEESPRLVNVYGDGEFVEELHVGLAAFVDLLMSIVLYTHHIQVRADREALVNDARTTGPRGRRFAAGAGAAKKWRRPTPVCWDRYPEAIRLFLRGATVPVAFRIALVVGIWLTLVNQGPAIASGSVPWVKVGLNVLTPFVVSSVGFLAARRRATLLRLWRELHDEAAGEGCPASALEWGGGGRGR
jgi:hypothetical protein